MNYYNKYNYYEKNIIKCFLFSAFVLTGCESEEKDLPLLKDRVDGGVKSSSCVTCEAYINNVAGLDIPVEEVKVCKGDNGNAFVEGIDTELKYENYLEGARSFTTCK